MMQDKTAMDVPVMGDDQVDETHDLQLRLVEAIESALLARDRKKALDLLGSLEDYSTAHFAAEQILMRFHSYPGYHPHVADHGRLVEELEMLRSRISEEDEAKLPAEAETVRRWLLMHIRTADQALAAFLEDSPVGA